jgi:hypothetical protein
MAPERPDQTSRMGKITDTSRGIIVALLVSVAVLVGSATSAAAAAPVPFDVPGAGQWAFSCAGYTDGEITWYNRTASLSGRVVGPVLSQNCDYISHTTAFFEAYAGTTKIDSQTRTLTRGDIDNVRPFGPFTIGDPDLVGGINRIKITVCDNFDDGGRACGPPKHYYR